MLKYIFLWIYLLALSSSMELPAQGTWQRIPVPTKTYLHSVTFADSLYGWASGDSGVIIHTSDGGRNWVRQNSNTTHDIPEIFFLNRRLGWASAFNYTEFPLGTKLLRTSDGGVTWTATNYPEPDIFITCILFRDSLHGWMGGKPHAIVSTADGGETWQQAEVDTSTLAFFPVLSIMFYNDKYGWASGGMFDIAGVVWRTNNGGKKWYAIDPVYAPADEVHALHAFDSLNVLGAGGDPDFGYGVGTIRTSDGGITWQYKEMSIPGFAVDLDFRTKKEAWATLGARHQFIYSLDGGNTWKDILTPDSTMIFDVTFPDSLHGYAVGRQGAFLKYTPPVGPGIAGNDLPEDQFNLWQHSPNPCSGSTTFRYYCPPRLLSEMPTGTGIRLKIIAITGETMMIRTLEDISSGYHQITLDVAKLPSGCYLAVPEWVTGTSALLARPVKFLIID